MGDRQSKGETSLEDDRVVHEFEWTIPNFQKLDYYGTGYCTVKDITFSGTEEYWFTLCLYPQGYNARTQNYVSLWLKKHSTNELRIGFTCGIFDGKGKEWCRKSTKRNLALESVVGWTTFFNRSALLDRETEVLTGGSLTLRGKIEIFRSSDIPNSEIEDDPLYDRSLTIMSDNFLQLLTDQGFTDFTMKVDGQRLYAHKAILSTRSPVFRRMLECPLQKNLREIDITDITYEALETVVKYIYTGRLGDISVPIAMEVYYAANKYEMKFLRDICFTMLSKNLLLNNVIDILLLAYSHSDLELKAVCLTFISKNLREIKGKSEWIDLMKEYPNLADTALFFHEAKSLMVDD